MITDKYTAVNSKERCREAKFNACSMSLRIAAICAKAAILKKGGIHHVISAQRLAEAGV